MFGREDFARQASAAGLSSECLEMLDDEDYTSIAELRRLTELKVNKMNIDSDQKQKLLLWVSRLKTSAADRSSFSKEEELQLKRQLDAVGIKEDTAEHMESSFAPIKWWSQHVKLAIEKHKNEDNIFIAISGESGCGKSSFINSLRSIEATSRAAASVGVTETTDSIHPYPFLHDGRVVVWDLPGVGTPKFPPETYLEKVKINRFDEVIICTCTRFTKLDLWLAKEVSKLHIPLCVVRTKIDIDIVNGFNDNRLSEKAVMDKVTTSIRNDLHANRIYDAQLFLVSTRLEHQTSWEFPSLMAYLVEHTPPKNKGHMVLAATSTSIDFIKEKTERMKKRIPLIAQEAVLSDGKHEQILEAETQKYIQWYNINPVVLQAMAVNLKRLDTGLQEIQKELDEVIKQPVKRRGRILGIRKLQQRRDDKAKADSEYASYKQIKDTVIQCLTETLDQCERLAIAVLTQRMQETLDQQR